VTADIPGNMIGIVMAASWIWGVAWSALSIRRTERARLYLERIIDQAAADKAFAQWANWTMLSVTDGSGYIHAATLRQLHRDGPWDQVWDAPVAVALWHGNPDVINRFTEEMDQEDKPSG
jgi:hypothetical protein